MTKFLGASFVASFGALMLASCATGGARVDREASSHARARFETTTLDSDPAFPIARNPKLPSADRIAGVVWSQLDGVASVGVHLCVAPDGHVQAVSVVRGSTLAAFDAAVKRDVTDWQFSGMPGSSSFASSLRTCELATITYRPHR
jgi:outer membrane biosynthesis protein TonB